MIDTIVFDFKETLYDTQNKRLVPRMEKLVAWLHKKDIPLVLYGKGTIEMHDVIKELGIEKYFQLIVFNPEKSVVQAQEFSSDKSIFIGDQLSSEITVGNLLGAITIRVNWGKYYGEKIKHPQERPDYTASTPETLQKILRKIIR